MIIDEYSLDTSYVPIPKKIEYFSRMKTYGIDTIGFSNAIELVSIKRTKKPIEPQWWKHKNSIGFDLNEVAFVNWNAGGVNSISGLFKVEFQGDGMVCLSSKTYCCEDKEEEKCKFSSKGLSKGQFTNPMHLYKSVMET